MLSRRGGHGDSSCSDDNRQDGPGGELDSGRIHQDMDHELALEFVFVSAAWQQFRLSECVSCPMDQAQAGASRRDAMMVHDRPGSRAGEL